MRELELASARAVDVEFVGGTSVRLALPVSKMDSRALGVHRSHFCIWQEDSPADPGCVVCALRRHRSLLALLPIPAVSRQAGVSPATVGKPYCLGPPAARGVYSWLSSTS